LLKKKIESFVPESKLYSDLVEFEKKLDAIIMRKRLDIQEALGKPTKVYNRGSWTWNQLK
jgi:SWI/SNF-related matrix-associated actin-dependent regulator of chromatin subfamily D